MRTESPLASGSKVQLTVRRQVEAYNGLQMQKDYQQEFTVVREVYAIGTDSIVEVPRGGERTVVVHAFPAQAAAGMKVTAKSVIGTIAMVTEEAIFDANGEARLTVTGKVGGQTALLLTLDGIEVFDALGLSVSTMGNIGPAFGIAGATCTYAGLSVFSKSILCISMLLGRLEMFTLLVMLTPDFWQKGNRW